MNQIFCFKRYVWLLKRQWYENATGYKWGIALMTLLVGAVFGLFVWVSTKQTNDNTGILLVGQGVAFGATGLLFLYIYGASFFKSLSSKNRKMFYFSLPVSPLERVAVAFSFVMILMPVLILTVFNVFDFVAVQIFNQIHDISGQMLFSKGAYTDYSSENFRVFLKINILAHLSYTSIFTLGSLMFGKKGPVVSIVSLIAFVIVCQWLWITFFGTLNSSFVMDYINNYMYLYLLPLCWAGIYFVMKRKEA